MDSRKILRLLLLSKFDVCTEKCTLDRVIYRSGKLKLFKCLMSSVCTFDCKYCYNPWHKGVSLTPEEFSRIFISLWERGIADSVFISSGMYSDPEKVMEDILEAGELIRKKFSGYMHLKIVPGANRDQVKRAVEIADRISINAEVAVRSKLPEVCSVKSKTDIERRARWIAKESKSISCTTQIVAGLGESDLDVLKFMERWYGMGFTRVYFSPFRAVKGTPYEGKRSESKKRVVNLYRADWLVRKYGIKIKKLIDAMEGENFQADPKVLLAKRFGVERAIELPGIGFKAAKLLESGKSLRELKKMGFSIKKASAFIPAQKKLDEFRE